MAAALGGMVSRRDPPDPEPAGPPPAPDPEPVPKTLAAPSASAPVSADDSVSTPAGDGDDGGGAYRRTGIGYVKADGTEMVRTVVMMTADERTRLKMLALEAGVSPSDYVRRAVGFTSD